MFKRRNFKEIFTDLICSFTSRTQFSEVWWCSPVISALGILRKKGPELSPACAVKAT